MRSLCVDLLGIQQTCSSVIIDVNHTASLAKVTLISCWSDSPSKSGASLREPVKSSLARLIPLLENAPGERGKLVRWGRQSGGGHAPQRTGWLWCTQWNGIDYMCFLTGIPLVFLHHPRPNRWVPKCQISLLSNADNFAMWWVPKGQRVSSVDVVKWRVSQEQTGWSRQQLDDNSRRWHGGGMQLIYPHSIMGQSQFMKFRWQPSNIWNG